jgi:RNA polymerase sigma-70 factor (ECF subfamily)
MLRARAAARQDAPAPPPPHRGESERQSFDAVYDACVDFVWRSVKRLGVEDASLDDVVQEVFFVVHRKLPEFTGRSSTKTWIFSILLHVVRHHRRTWRRKDAPRSPETTERLDELADPRARGPLEAAETADSVRLLDRLLQSLDDDKRDVFVLAHLEQMTAPEIAEILGENLNTVYSRLRAAREEFEEALERHRAHESWRRP